MTVIIKTVSGHHIKLQEVLLDLPCVESKFYLVVSLGLSIACAIGAIYFAHLNDNSRFAILIVSILCFAMVGLCVPVFRIGYRESPAYRVSSDIPTIGDTIVVKTTPEADQKAICNAVKSIEKQIHEKEEGKKRLEDIAGRCK